MTFYTLKKEYKHIIATSNCISLVQSIHLNVVPSVYISYTETIPCTLQSPLNATAVLYGEILHNVICVLLIACQKNDTYIDLRQLVWSMSGVCSKLLS